MGLEVRVSFMFNHQFTLSSLHHRPICRAGRKVGFGTTQAGPNTVLESVHETGQGFGKILGERSVDA